MFKMLNFRFAFLKLIAFILCPWEINLRKTKRNDNNHANVYAMLESYATASQSLRLSAVLAPDFLCSLGTNLYDVNFLLHCFEVT